MLASKVPSSPRISPSTVLFFPTPAKLLLAVSIQENCREDLTAGAAGAARAAGATDCCLTWLDCLTGCWCNNHLEKYAFVNGKDDIPYMKWKIKFMFQTTNQGLFEDCVSKSAISGEMLGQFAPNRRARNMQLPVLQMGPWDLYMYWWFWNLKPTKKKTNGICLIFDTPSHSFLTHSCWFPMLVNLQFCWCNMVNQHHFCWLIPHSLTPRLLFAKRSICFISPLQLMLGTFHIFVCKNSGFLLGSSFHLFSAPLVSNQPWNGPKKNEASRIRRHTDLYSIFFDGTHRILIYFDPSWPSNRAEAMLFWFLNFWRAWSLIFIL